MPQGLPKASFVRFAVVCVLVGLVAGTASAVARRVKVPTDVSAPTKLADARPVYPDDAKAAGIEGVVLIRIVIGTDGAVTYAEVVRSIPELDQAALDAVYQWKFTPTVLNGEAVEVEMTVTVNFTLG